MKEVHMICNAHLDPIWQWEWEEGAAAALSTFRSAADLCDEFDYVFCHNEVTLYKYIAEYAPELFARIKKLVAEGKWHIMGGWYLQPDCNMPQGESIVRQIRMGQRYFETEFGAHPTTAIGFDAFGHSIGLPQILKKCGQDSYILRRPGNDPIPDDQFWWEGLDGSRIKVAVSQSGYASRLGEAVKSICSKAEASDHDVVCALWGVGNHGGGPSRKDLTDIAALQKDGPYRLIHSTPEAFFARIHPTAVHRTSLRTSMPGCYTTMARVKQQHAALENALYSTEIACTAAAQRGLIEYPTAALNEAAEDLLNAEFHDVLPGTVIQAGEENGLHLLAHGLQICNQLRARAFFAMAAAEPGAADGEFPILVLNTQPYEWETDIACEFSLADQNWSAEQVSHFTVTDAAGQPVPFQVVKEESNLSLDWRKKIVFRGKLAPLALTRFSVRVTFAPAEPPHRYENDAIVLDQPDLHAEIDRRTGLLTSFRVNGTEQLAGGAFRPVMLDDNADPWGMSEHQLHGMGTQPRPFTLMTQPDGIFEGMQPVQVIEDGDIYLGVEAFFACEHTRIRLEYRLFKTEPKIDIRADVFAADANRIIKLEIPTARAGQYIGQCAFGTEPLYMDGRECVAQRFVAMQPESGDCLAVLNRGTYGSSCRDGVIALSLLRTATYCAHPIENRPLLPTDRYTKKIDMGERNFAFRLTVAPKCVLDRLATEFNRPPYASNVFPVPSHTKARPFTVALSDRNISLAAMKESDDGTVLLRLVHNDAEPCDGTLCINGRSAALHFGPYEVLTAAYDATALTVGRDMMI